MATKPRDLVTRFMSDVQGFLRGTDQVADAFDDMARDQRDLADTGEQSARELARAYDRAGDQIKRDARDAGRQTKASFKETGREAGQEFVANLGESVSSGDLSGIAAGTAGGLASTFGMAGPIGIAFAGLATGASLIFSQMSANAEKVKQGVSDMFDAITSGAEKQSILNTTLEREYGSVGEGILEIRRISQLTGVSVQEITDALTGTGGEADALRSKFDDFRAKAALGAEEMKGVRPGPQGLAAVAELRTLMERTAGQTERAKDAAQAYGEALRTAASIYSASGSAFSVGGSTYQSQVPGAGRYGKGRR